MNGTGVTGQDHHQRVCNSLRVKKRKPDAGVPGISVYDQDHFNNFPGLHSVPEYVKFIPGDRLGCLDRPLAPLWQQYYVDQHGWNNVRPNYY